MATPKVQNPYADSLATQALNTEREVTQYLETAFNLNLLGDVEDNANNTSAFKLIAHINAAIIRLTQFENSILNRCKSE